MLKIKLILGIFLLIFLTNHGAEATKLNYPRVLLPIFNRISINFTLEVMEGGCFKWTSSRQDLILITPLYEDTDTECSPKATVTVLSRERRRNTAIVLAENMNTGDALRCDVILDVIDTISVRTTTRQLYLEEAPETFELRAEDSQGNEFTTLEGIEFNWQLTPLNEESRYTPALRFLTFSESPYHAVPPSLEEVERRGLQGYMILLEGINTGAAKVTVSIPYAEYSHIQPLEVYINVLANIILEPAEAHIMVGDSIKFRILQLKMGKLHEISMNAQYYLEVLDENVARLKVDSATGLTLGRTTIVVRDRNVPKHGSLPDASINPEASVPAAVLTVAEPYKLGVRLLPHNNWITVQGEKHEIAFDLYTHDDQKITLGSRYEIRSEFDHKLFVVSERNNNGTRLAGVAENSGISPVYGSFKDLSVQAQLQIYAELWLTPTHVVLPFDPNGVRRTQHIQFHVTGGDGSYLWHTQNPRLIQINANGLASTIIRDMERQRLADFAMNEGGSLLHPHAQVRVALARNPKIQRQANIYFMPPVKLQIVKYNFETALGDYVHLHVALFTKANNTLVPFTLCENLVFDVEFSSTIFHVDKESTQAKDLFPGACTTLHLRSTAKGVTHARVSYKFQDKQLRDEVYLSVFEPLIVANPLENEIVLPIGASRNIIYADGPQRIPNSEAELTKVINYEKNIVDVVEVPQEYEKDLYVFTVLCRKVGPTELNINIYNVLENNNYAPYPSQIKTKIHCVKPRFLNLYSKVQLRNSCPLEGKSSIMHLKENNNKFEIEIEVQDAKNRQLMNISSLELAWEFHVGHDRYDSRKVQYHREEELERFRGIEVPKADYLVTTFKEVTSNLRIKGMVVRYVEKVLTEHGITPEKPIFGVRNAKTGLYITPTIENEIHFIAVNSTIFSRNNLSLFMAKNHRERVPINQGSGYFDYELTAASTGVVNVEFEPKLREFLITPLRMGHAELIVTDRCLMSEPTVLSISVVAIGAIVAQSPDRVERTKSIEAIIKVYDSNDELLHINYDNLAMYELWHEVFNPDILSVKLGPQTDLGVGEIRYIITGNELGETKVVFNAGAKDKSISSQPIIVQVFSPLRLYPRNSTLVVGSNLQIYHHGGPQSDLNIVYEVHDRKVISMESAIVTAHKLGETKITGKCVILSPATGSEVVISEDTIEVYVVPLVNIQIRTPLVRIRSGAVMPATIWGLPDLSPMILGSLDNMEITWSSNQPDVVEIYNVFSDIGIEYGRNDLISVRIKALNPGKARIQASVQLGEGESMTAVVDVIVFKILELESPKHISMDWILMAPRSTIQLKANLDDAHYVPDKKDSSGIVQVTSDGVLRSKETLGRDLIIAKTFEQTLPIGIEVKNIQYILASLEKTNIKLKRSIEKIPRGMSFALKVSLHDNLGNEFSHSIEDNNALRYELSQKDVVDVQIGNNMTLAINLPRETSNMIAISLRDSNGVKHAEDYIKLSVAESKYTFPRKTIFAVGDVVCFDSPLSLASQWTSSDERILTIDKYTGIAKVLGNRDKGEKVVVTNGDRSTGNLLKYDVEIRDVDVISVRRSQDIFSGSSYRGYFVLRHHTQTDKFTNLIASNVSKCASLLPESIPVKLFTCHLTSKEELGQQLLQHYKVSSVFDALAGNYACQVDIVSSFTDVLALVKNNEVFMDLEIRLPSGLFSVTHLKFVPGIKVSPESLLASDLEDQEIIVTGLDRVLQKVEVKSSDPTVLQVIPQLTARGTLHYKIKTLVELPMDEQLHVLIQSPDTRQSIKVPIVAASSVAEKCSVGFYQPEPLFVKLASNLGLMVTAVFALAVTIWAYVVCGTYTTKEEVNLRAFSRIKPNMSRATSGSQSLASVGSGPSLAGSSSFTRNSSRSYSPGNSRQHFTMSRSPYCGDSNASESNLSALNDPQVYGDTLVLSPQKRINRSFL